MTLTHFVIFACAVYLAIVLGRMSAKNDMRRRFASIDEGQNFSDVESVINYILNLRDQVEQLMQSSVEQGHLIETLSSEKELLQDEIKDLTAKCVARDEEYMKLLEQMKNKRNQCDHLRAGMEILRKDNNHLEDNLTKARKAVDELMAKAYKLAEEMNNECGEVITKGAKYAKAMDMSAIRLIYAYKLHNKTTLLTAGVCALGNNGKISYPAGSRSLGNAQSKENAECFAKLTASLNLDAGESKCIGVIHNYEDLKACAKTFSGIEHGVTKIIGISAELMNYLALNKGMLNKIK